MKSRRFTPVSVFEAETRSEEPIVNGELITVTDDGVLRKQVAPRKAHSSCIDEWAFFVHVEISSLPVE